MDALCKCIFIIIEIIVNIEHGDYVSKVKDVFQRTCLTYIRHMAK